MSHPQESFESLFKNSLANAELIPGTLIKGTVIKIDKDYVTVNAGLKSEGAIPREQFTDVHGELCVELGDEVDVALEMVEDGYGETRLSREKAKRAEAWAQLQSVHDTNEKIVGVIAGRVKGGFTVDIQGLKAFLPGSLVDMRPMRESEIIEGKEIELKVIKMDIKRNNIVVSRRAVLEDAISEERSGVIENLREGDEIEGVVKNLTDYGAFVDLGGVDGLLHITDMSWKRIKHPNELITIGGKVKVVVLKIDREHGRVSLGMKQLGGDPWRGIESRYPVGTRMKGKITNITDYGCFIELEEGIEGLVHMSEMDWTNKNVQPSKLVKLGQEAEVIVLEIDGSRRRISLGMKQCVNNPWTQFAETHKKGERISGKIKSVTDFGVFVGLTGDIDGLIHVSDVAWDQTEAEEMVRNFKKGEEIEAVILAIEPDRERISLGIKQFQQDPFTDYTMAHNKGEVVIGKVVEVDGKQLKVELAEGIYGIVKAADNVRKREGEGNKDYKVGDEAEARIMGIDHKLRVIQLSIKALEQVDAKALKDINRSADAATKTTLGDILLKAQEDSQNKE
jgi:small subunit ribosomal protein S1